MIRRKIMDNQDLLAFKDGVADAILEGHRSEYHENMYFYKIISYNCELL